MISGVMPRSPYAPPKSEVADVLPKEPVRWGRAAWLHLPVFALLVILVFGERHTLSPGFASWGMLAGLMLTAVLLYFPVRSLHTLDDGGPPWWTDVLYYATVGMFLLGVVFEDANLLVAGGAVLQNDATGCAST
jgi:hypothetical protein